MSYWHSTTPQAEEEEENSTEMSEEVADMLALHDAAMEEASYEVSPVGMKEAR